MTSVKYLLFYMELLNYSFCDMFGSVLECYELTHISFTVHKLCRYNNEQATKQTKAINNSYIFVVVNFDALAQASDIQIERQQVVFLCWMQDLNPGSQTPNRQQTISCKCDTNRAGHFTIDAHASRPVACSTLLHRINMRSSKWASETYLRGKHFACYAKKSFKWGRGGRDW